VIGFVQVALALCGPPCDACAADGAEACSCNVPHAEIDRRAALLFPERAVIGFDHTGPGCLGELVLLCGHRTPHNHFANGQYPRRAACLDCAVLP
jgi:hypothetical protein